MTKQEAFVIGDIHGMYHLLEELLTHWRPEDQQLIFVGDLIDRGPNSKATVEKVRELQASHGAICLCGNHEDMLLETLTDPENYFGRYKRNGGLTTISEFLETTPSRLEDQSGQLLSACLKETQPWLQAWLESLPLYTEFGNFIIVHAGVNPEVDQWQDSSRRDFVWIREPFHTLPNKTGRPIIFGHTPIGRLNDDGQTHHVWHREGDLIGIDGGAVYGGHLLAVRINHETLLETFCVPSDAPKVDD